MFVEVVAVVRSKPRSSWVCCVFLNPIHDNRHSRANFSLNEKFARLPWTEPKLVGCKIDW